MSRTTPLIAAVLAALALLAAACGDEQGSASGARTTAVAAADEAARYCALTRELEAAGERFFAGLGRDARPSEFEAAERRFVLSERDRLAELQRAAPARIRDDVATIVAGMRARGGLDPGAPVSQADADAADARVRAYERRACRG